MVWGCGGAFGLSAVVFVGVLLGSAHGEVDPNCTFKLGKLKYEKCPAEIKVRLM